MPALNDATGGGGKAAVRKPAVKAKPKAARKPAAKKAAAPAPLPFPAVAPTRLQRIRAAVKKPTTVPVRQRVVAWALWGVKNEPQIHYSMGTNRDDWLTRAPGKLALTTDCSGFATACYKWAGAPDPSGLGYRKLGYTGTLLAHMRHIPRAAAKPGDLVVFGPETGHHVVILVDPGTAKDPRVVSHGQEKGPQLLPLSVEAAYQPKPVTFLSILG